MAGQGTYLTLRRLQLWLAEPLRRMRLLAALVDAAEGCIGGDLAGRVWAASKVGDPVARAYATRLLQQVRQARQPLPLGPAQPYVCLGACFCLQAQRQLNNFVGYLDEHGDVSISGYHCMTHACCAGMVRAGVCAAV